MAGPLLLMRALGDVATAVAAAAVVATCAAASAASAFASSVASSATALAAALASLFSCAIMNGLFLTTLAGEAARAAISAIRFSCKTIPGGREEDAGPFADVDVAVAPPVGFGCPISSPLVGGADEEAPPNQLIGLSHPKASNAVLRTRCCCLRREPR